MDHPLTFDDTVPGSDDGVAGCVAGCLRQRMFAVVPRMVLAKAGAIGEEAGSEWTQFANTWDHLAADTYMADGGRYRRRRYASLTVAADGTFSLNAHRPHFQAKSFNHLNGGIDRWFEPILPHVLVDKPFTALLDFAYESVQKAAPDHRRWDVEVHQFRITAMAGHEGLPTPEGLHRDGVDFVFMTLINRVNVSGGVSEISDDDGCLLATLEMREAGTSVLVDDRHTRHGVSAITANDPEMPAYRDMLVVTFRAL